MFEDLNISQSLGTDERIDGVNHFTIFMLRTQQKVFGLPRPCKASRDVSKAHLMKFERMNVLVLRLKLTFHACILVDRPAMLLAQWIMDTGRSHGKMIDVGGGNGHVALNLAQVRYAGATNFGRSLTALPAVPHLEFYSTRSPRSHVFY